MRQHGFRDFRGIEEQKTLAELLVVKVLGTPQPTAQVFTTPTHKRLLFHMSMPRAFHESGDSKVGGTSHNYSINYIFRGSKSGKRAF